MTTHSADTLHGADCSGAHALFQQPWWLDAVAPRRWAEVAVEHGGRTVARLPFVVRGSRRMRVLTQPPLTPFLGPWVAPSTSPKYSTALGDEMDLLDELHARLPAAAAFRQSFAPEVSSALPFIWAGCRAEVRYTYRLDGLGSEEQLWNGLGSNIRNAIRKARRKLEVRDDLGVDAFYTTWAKTFQRQRIAPPDRALVERVEAACAPRGARTTLFACDESGRVHAVAYVVWDQRAAYYLMSGADPTLRSSGAGSLLLWEAIMRARRHTDVFDFEGSMLRPVERFFRDFGGRQTPYLHVGRATGPARTALAVRGALVRLADRRARITRSERTGSTEGSQ